MTTSRYTIKLPDSDYKIILSARLYSAKYIKESDYQLLAAAMLSDHTDVEYILNKNQFGWQVISSVVDAAGSLPIQDKTSIIAVLENALRHYSTPNSLDHPATKTPLPNERMKIILTVGHALWILDNLPIAVAAEQSLKRFDALESNGNDHKPEFNTYRAFFSRSPSYALNLKIACGDLEAVKSELENNPQTVKNLKRTLLLARYVEASPNIINELQSHIKRLDPNAEFTWTRSDASIEKFLQHMDEEFHTGFYQKLRNRKVQTLVICAIFLAAAIALAATLPPIILIPAAVCFIGFAIAPYKFYAQYKENSKLARKSSVNYSEALDLNNRFKIPGAAKANIDILDKMSPGLVNDLQEHFAQRIAVAEEYAKTLGKDRESGIIDNSEIHKLESDWHKIIESAVKGTESFCLEVTSYLSNFEANQQAQAAANLGPYAEDKRSTLRFAAIDKKIAEHINEIAAKTNLKL